MVGRAKEMFWLSAEMPSRAKRWSVQGVQVQRLDPASLIIVLRIPAGTPRCQICSGRERQPTVTLIEECYTPLQSYIASKH